MGTDSTYPPLFEINNLSCEYVSKRTVLQIQELSIPAQKLIFIIGRSGIGKSTFIETIGLMNKTIAAKASSSLVFRPIMGEPTELKDCWDWSNNRLSSFRQKHFSFIFQQTNLMPNFTSGENMAMSLMIKGYSFDKAKEEVLKVMGKLSLGPEIFDKKVTEVSGGQRQRLAFVRAITADFDVLFGDEPTGNLDTKTSKDLMDVLKASIQGGKTAIMVSHNLQLAADFADMIIPISAVIEDGEAVSGIISSSHLLQKNDGDWHNHNGEKISSITEHLSAYLY